MLPLGIKEAAFDPAGAAFIDSESAELDLYSVAAVASLPGACFRSWCCTRVP